MRKTTDRKGSVLMEAVIVLPIVCVVFMATWNLIQIARDSFYVKSVDLQLNRASCLSVEGVAAKDVRKKAMEALLKGTGKGDKAYVTSHLSEEAALEVPDKNQHKWAVKHSGTTAWTMMSALSAQFDYGKVRSFDAFVSQFFGGTFAKGKVSSYRGGNTGGIGDYSTFMLARSSCSYGAKSIRQQPANRLVAQERLWTFPDYACLPKKDSSWRALAARSGAYGEDDAVSPPQEQKIYERDKLLDFISGK